MNQEEKIKQRIFSVIPSSSLHMMELLKLFSIRFVDNDITHSAAITCNSRPELLLNKDFIDLYCKTDEHLMMLIMHELYHLILGHTKLFNRHNEIDNIAFDAVINALLCRMFPSDEYTSFFTNINDDSNFPGCLLRPIGKNTPKEFLDVLNGLYNATTGTYFEVYESINKKLSDLLSSGKLQYVLLGNHRDDENVNNPLLKKILADVISKWPRENIFIGRDLGGELEKRQINFEKIDKSSKNKMMRLLKKSGVIEGIVTKRKKSSTPIKYDAMTFFPNYNDRTILTKSILYRTPLLFNNQLTNNNANEHHLKTLVYLDVSGSVKETLNKFAPLLLKPYKNKECLLYAFSTEVVPVTYQEFIKGSYNSTLGTSIDSIFEHYFSLPKKKQAKKILILTDGYTGKVNGKYYELIKRQKIKVYCGLFGDYTKEDLENITNYFEEFKQL